MSHQDLPDQFDLSAALSFFSTLVLSLDDLHLREGPHLALCLINIRINGDTSVSLLKDDDAPVAYISPEQTGRMNRQVDYRSDYYSLGVIFYEFLTGQLPFASESAMELIYSHIAKRPLAPHKLNHAVPEVVSDIVMKLLSKNAEDRYQRLSGLAADLQRCFDELSINGSITYFSVGENDISDHLQIPQKLYGRDLEVGRLKDAFARVAGGGVELLLITGYSGIGKSSLVHEIHKPVVARRGYFISGKFDQIKRNVPYSAINQAFRELMRQILTESESRIASWRTKLLKALGTNGQLIIDVIPELEFIIGKQPPVPQLGATRISYDYVIQNFVDVFTKPEHPIVLFLDDLQWADAASLKLIDLLMKVLDDPCLLVIGAYRDNDIDEADPLMLTIDSIRRAATVSSIEVRALSQISITELVADTVHAAPAVVAPLAALIYRKTLGNPFFVGQFLKTLYNDGLLRFEHRTWCWDVEQIDRLGITDNVVDLLMKELHRLPAGTQRLLNLASCIGNRFGIRTLATVSENSVEQALTQLQQALAAGLIRKVEEGSSRSSDSFLFLHDRVQQAAYEGIPDDEKKAVHLEIGRLLQNSMSEEERKEHIFDIVQQMNEGRSLIVSATDRDALANLNLLAAQTARKSAAFDLHRECIEIAHEFGGTEIWQLKPEFMYELHMELVSAAFARADYIEMERLCKLVCDNSTNPKQAIAAKDMLIRCYAALYKPQKILQTGIESLALAGMCVPEKLGRGHVMLARLRLNIALRGRNPLMLLSLPPVKDQQYLLQLQASNLLLGYGTVYLGDSNVVLWIAIEMIHKAICNGLSPYCTYALSVWARTLAGTLNKPDHGYLFGKISAEIALDSGMLGAVGIFHGVLRHHKEHLRLALQPLMDTYAKAMETGDRASAMVALSFSEAIRFQAGYKVNEGLNQIRKNIAIYRKMNYPALLGTMIPWAMLFAKLVGESIDTITQGATEDDFVASRSKNDDLWGVFHVRSSQCVAEYYFGDYRKAIDHTEEAINLPGFWFGHPASGFLMFISSLSHLAYCDIDKAHEPIAISMVTRNQKRFRSWAERAPMNYLHKWQLVEAERWRLLGYADNALRHYELAIKGARENSFLNDEALANELLGKFYQDAGKEMTARAHLEEAHAKYQEWGAYAKLKQLEEIYPRLLSRVAGRKGAGAIHTIAGKNRLDIDTIIEASHTLFGEIQFDKLLAKVMHLLMANAGAQKGVLLLQQDDALLVQAQAIGDHIEVRQKVPVELASDLCLAIINYVRRTRQKVVLGDAANDSRFNTDPYMVLKRPKSVLCIPLQKQSELIGILYLENNLAIDAFTANHTELLEILSTQIAISLENAGLYTELEYKIDLRTQALKQKNSELSEALISLKYTQKQLVESEKLASLGQLVAGVAHEINTPVGVGVTGASTLAEETSKLERLYLSGEMKRSDLEHYVHTASAISRLLLSNMERAATLTQSFKEVAIDQTSQEQRTFRLSDYIREVLLNLNPLLRKTSHAIDIECDESLEVHTYPGALSQILTNFVMNALMHAFHEGDAGKISIIVNVIDQDLIELHFSDNGKGIAEDNLAKIFDPFFTTKRGQGGSGLGLSIIHNLATGSLHGTVSVHSKLNEGTTFTLRFPRVISVQQQTLDVLATTQDQD